MNELSGTPVELSPNGELWMRTKASLDDGADGVPLVLGPYFSFIVRRSPRRLLHMLSYYKFAAKMIGTGRRVLEVGCSEGLGTLVLAENASEVVGLDLDRDAIAIANATVGSARLRFVVGDAMQMSLGRFDAAVSLDTVEHIPREREHAFVGGIVGQLTPNGVFVIGTPNEVSDRYASPHTRAGHINLYSADRLRALCEEHFENLFMFSANDEVVHTGFAPMAHYLLALCVGPRKNEAC